MTIADTIIQQLGGGRFVVLTGAHTFVAGGKSLTFKVGRNAMGVTHVRITLNAADLYDVEWLAVRKLECKQKRQSSFGVHAENLRRVFTENTGLETSL